MVSFKQRIQSVTTKGWVACGVWSAVYIAFIIWVACGDARILASYKRPGHPTQNIWIITEADRSATTVLFPDEY